MKLLQCFFTVCLLFTSVNLLASEAPDTDPSDTTTETEPKIELSEDALKALYASYIDSVEQTMDFQNGSLTLGDDIASLDVPTGFRFLNSEDTRKVLIDLWGNPPNAVGPENMGMLVPEGFTSNGDDSYAIEISFIEDGYIDDEDAREMDYDELLETMQEDTEASNEMRIEEGYGSIELVGWASPPFYDSEHKKLHWAKELNFDGDEINILNYNIRFLGRRGFLQLTAVSDIDVLPKVQTSIDPILNAIHFKDGHKYSDFNPKLDKIAKYGIGGLIAGKMLAKTGILAKLAIMLAKSWKILAVVVFGFFGAIRRFFGGGKSEEESQRPS